MKKRIFALGLLMLGAFGVRSQGLEGIIVEKYYVSNATDAAANAATTFGGALPVGSTTYRIYVDMAAGYKFQALYGVAAHELRLSTSTVFFNQDNGGSTPNFSRNNNRTDLAILDSWFSAGAVTAIGGATSTSMGIPKSLDPDGAITPFSPAGTIANNPGLPAMDPPAVTVKDGFHPSSGSTALTPEAVTFVGITAAEQGIFLDGSANAAVFSEFDGSVASLNGSVGSTADNIVCIGQFTTDGTFCWKLNVQLGTPLGGTENYVADSPVGAEQTFAGLTGCAGPNAPPTVTINTPTNGQNVITGASVPVNASASDASPGTVAQVQFFVDGASIGIDNSGPSYDATWPSATPVGAHTIVAVATDDQGATGSDTVIINVVANPPPTCSITAPAALTNYIAPDAVAITASATDNVSVANVEFFVDGGLIGSDNTSTYNFTWTPSTVGTHTLTCRATDNQGAQTTSSGVSIIVNANQPPVVNITAPINGSSTTSTLVAISATATDPDLSGSITSVEFFQGATSIGFGTLSGPNTYTINANVSANINQNVCFTAMATDDRSGQTTSNPPVCIFIQDVNAAYIITSIDTTCHPAGFCLPIKALAAVDDVIGYDVELDYDQTRVTPVMTGTNVAVTNGNLALNSAIYYETTLDALNGKIYITYALNASGTEFNGPIGSSLFCVSFTKLPAFASVDTADFTATLLESYITGTAVTTVSPGSYITHRDIYYHGHVKYFTLGGSPEVGGVPVRSDNGVYLNTGVSICANNGAPDSQVDSLGNFLYITTPLGAEDIKVVRDVPNTNAGMPVVSGFDAFRINQILAGTYAPNEYQLIAADVNLDGKVSAGDVTQVNQRVVNMIGEFKQAWNYNNAGVKIVNAASKDWLFQDTTLNFVNAGPYNKNNVPQVDTCTIVHNDLADCPTLLPTTFVGSLLGDVDGSWADLASNAQLLRQNTGRVMFDLSNAVISNGHIDVPVSVSYFEVVNSLDFALQYNEAKFAFNSIIANNSNMQTLSHYSNADQTLRFTTNSLENLPKNTTLVTIRFDVLSGTGISSKDLASLKGYINGKQATVTTDGAAITQVDFRIYPNPANNLLNIEVAQDAYFQLLDISGKQIIAETHVTANEKLAINTESIASGIYMIRIYNNTSVTMQKVVINK